MGVDGDGPHETNELRSSLSWTGPETGTGKMMGTQFFHL